MAKNLQAVIQGAMEIKSAAKPVGMKAMVAASTLRAQHGALETAVAGNSHSGPAAVEALGQAEKALQDVSDAIAAMDRSIDGFISDMQSR